MKKLLTVALSVALLLSTTACGTNSELEAKKQKNEQLKQTIDELKKDLAQQTSSPQSTDAPKQSDYLASDGNIAVTKQETYGENYEYIETQFTIKNLTDKNINTFTLHIGEYDKDKNLISGTYPQIPETIAPGETAVISATHSMDFELIQNVRVTGYDYLDESQNYTNNNINNAPFRECEKKSVKNNPSMIEYK